VSYIRTGKYISIHAQNKFFNNVAEMLLEYFDVPERNNNLFVLSSYIHNPVDKFRILYPKHKIIIYQLEQMLSCNTFYNPEKVAKNIIGADEIWDYDPLNIEWLSWRGIKVDRLVPMLYTKSLEWKERKDPTLDLVFLGVMNKKRFDFFSNLQSRAYGKIKFSWVFGDEEMKQHIQNAKVSLNLHTFEPWNRQEQVRMFVPVINGHTVVSEVSQKNMMEGAILEVDQNNLADYLLEICYNNKWKEFGPTARNIFKDKTNILLQQWPETIGRTI
jgi:hypothetical protein